ncbi:MAG: transcriptional regulator [Mucilaginibacter sp.]|nr:transcriptional regulator [Mucilaginibacter sp.]
MMREPLHSKEACTGSVNAVKDALYALNGKWKLPLIVTLSGSPKRFKDIQRELENITPKILSKELKELELNGFVERKVFKTTPVTVTYELTPYSSSLDKIIIELMEWGIQHRKHIISMRKNEKNQTSEVLKTLEMLDGEEVNVPV